MSTHLNGGQAAIVLVLTMMGAVVNGALDALIRGVVHDLLLLHEIDWRDAGSSLSAEKIFYARKKRSQWLLFVYRF